MDRNSNESNIFTGNKKTMESLSKIDFNQNANLSSASMIRPNNAEKFQQIMADTHKRKAQYEADLVSTLKAIEQNTANLGEIVGLIQSSNTQQEEMLSILSEIMNIAKASNKEEAEKMWKKIMTKITSTVDGVDSITKLIGFGTIVYNQVIENLDKIIK